MGGATAPLVPLLAAALLKEDITIFPSYLAPISVKWLPVSERNARV